MILLQMDFKNPTGWKLEHFPTWHVCKCNGYEGMHVNLDKRRAIKHGAIEIWIFQGSCKQCGREYWKCSDLIGLLNSPNIMPKLLTLVEHTQSVPREANAY